MKLYYILIIFIVHANSINAQSSEKGVSKSLRFKDYGFSLSSDVYIPIRTYNNFGSSKLNTYPFVVYNIAYSRYLFMGEDKTINFGLHLTKIPHWIKYSTNIEDQNLLIIPSYSFIDLGPPALALAIAYEKSYYKNKALIFYGIGIKTLMVLSSINEYASSGILNDSIRIENFNAYIDYNPDYIPKLGGMLKYGYEWLLKNQNNLRLGLVINVFTGTVGLGQYSFLKDFANYHSGGQLSVNPSSVGIELSYIIKNKTNKVK